MQHNLKQAQPECIPHPIRKSDGAGATDYGPRDVMRDRENPDMFVPPVTDEGLVPNLKFSFSDAHMQLNQGGWSREITVRELPVAKTLAGVNMRLTPGGVRELHWHQQAEWAFMILGRARITAVDQNGRNLLPMSVRAICGISPRAFLIRFRGWRKAASSCLSSMTAISPI